jgi:3'-phosphoadenosine 5'-phosphosulfate sulfotransferase (PAPS reductase)/FAD synthetase
MGGGQCYISFSGGKDSTVLLHIARHLFPDIKGVYVDTGLEYPEIKEFVKMFDNVDIIRPKKSFKQVLEEEGYPLISKEVSQAVLELRRELRNNFAGCRSEQFGLVPKSGKYAERYSFSNYAYLKDAPFKISHKCCSIMKKNPSREYTKRTGMYPIVATMASESQLRKTNWIRYGCNAFDSKNPHSAPMSFWTEQDVLQYIKLQNLPIAKVYGDIVEDNNKLKCTGCSRTGCIFCMFGVHLEKEPNRFQRLKQTHPQLHTYCMEKLGLKEVCDLLKIKTE